MAYSPNSFSGYSRSGSTIAAAASPNNFLQNTIPGYTDASSSAMDAVNNLLKGLPSVDATRQANAYFGVGSGMPNSDFVRNRGYDLYGQAGEQRKQTGIQDFNSLIGSISGPTLANQGQQFQNQQFGAQLGQNQNQFDQNFQLQQFLAQLQALGLGNNIVNSGRNQPSPFLG